MDEPSRRAAGVSLDVVGGFEGYLDLVAELTGAFARSPDITRTVAQALTRITGFLGAEAGSAFLIQPDGKWLVCRACVGPVDITGLSLPIERGIVGRSVRERRSLLVRDAQSDPDFAGQVDAKTGFVTRSILCAPLAVAGETLGALELINKSGAAHFEEADCRVLEALAGAAAMALINARQAAELVERERLSRELELAAEIQRGLLPGRAPDGAAIHGINLPARAVSGDFFDVVALEDGRQCFALADVAGKGMNAALVMAKTASLFHCLAKTQPDPSALLATLNDEIAETATRGLFVTMAVGLYDPAIGRVTLASAGHEPALRIDPTGARFHLPAAAPPLGVVPSGCDPARFPAETLSLDGGALYLFSDGVTEGRLADGQMMSRDGVADLLAAAAELAPALRLDRVAAALGPAGQPLHDDVTLLVVDDAAARARRREGVTLLRLRRPAMPENLREIRAAVRGALARAGCPEDLARDLVLAVDEACQNIIRHGYGPVGRGDIDLVLRHGPGRLVFELADTATPVGRSGLRPRARAPLAPGGLGLRLIGEIMDEVIWLDHPAGRGNLLRLVKCWGGLEPGIRHGTVV